MCAPITHGPEAGQVFDDIAEALHHLAARIGSSPGPAHEDFEAAVGRIKATGDTIRAEVAAAAAEAAEASGGQEPAA